MKLMSNTGLKSLMGDWLHPERGKQKREVLNTLLNDPIFLEARALATAFGPAPKAYSRQAPAVYGAGDDLGVDVLAGRYLFEKGVLDAFQRLEDLALDPPENKLPKTRTPKSLRPDVETP
jgi:hypothetical protein